MPARFDKMGVQFLYPENWTLDEQDAGAGERSVSVSSPSGAFWSITIRPWGDDPQKLADAALEAMRQIYSDMDSEEVEETFAGWEMVGHDIHFYCLDFLNTAEVRAFSDDRSTYVVLSQAEDREYDQLANVFRAITTSLVAQPAAEDEEG